MRSCDCVSSCCAAACSSATCTICLRTFQVGTAFLGICTTTEPWVFASNTSPISPSSPNLLLLTLPYDVSTPLHNTRCLLCQWKENWQLRPMPYTEWFRQGSDAVRSMAVLHAQLPQFSLLHHVVCFVSHFLLVLFGHGDLKRRQIGCS